MRILVVEEATEQRAFLEASLDHAKGPCTLCVSTVTFEVEAAGSVEEARRMIQDRRYDFVLLDPIISGHLETSSLLPMLKEKGTPYAFYTENVSSVQDDAPVWTKFKGLRMDLVTRICDYYQSFAKKRRKQAGNAPST